jgi:hypothetical protein
MRPASIFVGSWKVPGDLIWMTAFDTSSRLVIAPEEVGAGSIVGVGAKVEVGGGRGVAV